MKIDAVRAAFAALALAGGLATGPAAGADDSAAMLAKLRKAYPATRIDAVQASAIPGLYEVAMGRNIAYVEAEGRYFLFGHLYDLPAGKDLTAARMATLATVKPAALPSADGFTVRRARQPTQRLALFSDPNCGYCRALEKTLAQLPEIEVTVYLLPLQDGSDAPSAAVWCAKDRAQAWQALMLGGKAAAASPSPGCDTGVLGRNRELARTLGIQGTPTLIAADGRLQAGALERAALLAWLNSPVISAEASR